MCYVSIYHYWMKLVYFQVYKSVGRLTNLHHFQLNFDVTTSLDWFRNCWTTSWRYQLLSFSNKHLWSLTYLSLTSLDWFAYWFGNWFANRFAYWLWILGNCRFHCARSIDLGTNIFLPELKKLQNFRYNNSGKYIQRLDLIHQPDYSCNP